MDMRIRAPAFEWRVHQGPFAAGAALCLEVRPPEGKWKPFVFGVPLAEREKVVALMPGPPGSPPTGALVSGLRSGRTPDGAYWCWQCDNAATPTQSYFAYLTELPTAAVFGQADGLPQFRLDVREVVGADFSAGDEDRPGRR